MALDEKKVGIRVIMTQETNDTSHYLFEIFNVHSVSERDFKGFLEKIIPLATDLVRGRINES